MRKWLWILIVGVVFGLMAQSYALSKDVVRHEKGDLEEVLSNQAKILTVLDEIKEELKIVKIRATLR